MKMKRFGLLFTLLACLGMFGCGLFRDTDTKPQDITNVTAKVTGDLRSEGSNEIPVARSYEQISQEAAKSIMESEEGIIILDVRREEEYKEGHIPGAICIPNETIGSEPIKELPDKDQKILVYCRSGNRSKQAAQKLFDQGYTKVLEFGGINSWKEKLVKD